MSPKWIAACTALVSAIVASQFSIDYLSQRFVASWIPKRDVRVRVILAFVHAAAAMVMTATALGLGWKPDASASAWTAMLHGVAWAGAAVAVLRTETSGFPGSSLIGSSSLLREIFERTVKNLDGDARQAVVLKLPDERDRLAALAFDVLARRYSQEIAHGVRDPVYEELRVRVAESHEAMVRGGTEEIEARSHLRELITSTVLEYKICRADLGYGW
jgi:hypothetical protein